MMFRGWPYERVAKKLAELERKVEMLYPKIAHGDKDHRAWLSKRIQDHFDGDDIKPCERATTLELCSKTVCEHTLYMSLYSKRLVSSLSLGDMDGPEPTSVIATSPDGKTTSDLNINEIIYGWRTINL